MFFIAAPDGHYNCFAYAVNEKDWLLVDGDWSNPFYQFKEEHNLIPVEKKDMVLGKEYVAYRYCANDFHFMKRDAKGHWRHKMGSSHAEAISQKEVFAKSWNFGYHTYNSKLYLFVRA